VHRGHPIKWFVGFAISVHLLAGAWSADRAWKQVRSLEVRVAGPEIAAGSAVVRAVASGRPQWLRSPPPVVREVPVTLVRS